MGGVSQRSRGVRGRSWEVATRVVMEVTPREEREGMMGGSLWRVSFGCAVDPVWVGSHFNVVHDASPRG